MRKKELIKKVDELQNRVDKHERTIKEILDMLEPILMQQVKDSIAEATDELNKLFETIFKQPVKKQNIKKTAKEEVKPQPKRSSGRPRKVIKGEQ